MSIYALLGIDKCLSLDPIFILSFIDDSLSHPIYRFISFVLSQLQAYILCYFFPTRSHIKFFGSLDYLLLVLDILLFALFFLFLFFFEKFFNLFSSSLLSSLFLLILSILKNYKKFTAFYLSVDCICYSSSLILRRISSST